MDYNFYDDMSVLHGYMPYNDNKLNLSDPYEGFLKGNAFRDQYIPYKDYKPLKLNINSEQEELLFNISEYGFMMHDLNLYLDLNPSDREALDKFNEYRNKCNELVNKYERKYGPLLVNDSDTKMSFNWVNKWPWVN